MISEKSDTAMSPPAADARANSLVTVSTPPTPRSRPRRRLIAMGVAAVLGLGLAAVWWGQGGSGGATRVPVETLAPGPAERILAVSGRTETDVHSDIRSLVSARVTEVRVSEGDAVAIGDELLLLDASQQNSRVRQALAALDAAMLTEQRAQADRDRASSLAGTLSAVTIANAERDLALAAAEVSRLRAALEQAQLALPDYRITAPITGVVLSRSVEPGDLVGPTDILMRLANIDDLHVAVQIDEIYADQIHVGQRAWLQLAGRAETLTGEVSFVAAEVDELTGSLRVKLAFDTVPDAQIGLTTVANILVERVDAALTVPRSALVAGGADAAVFVLRDGRARLTPIAYVDWPADRVEVTSGLAEGDRVVVSPDGIADGQEVIAQDTVAAGE